MLGPARSSNVPSMDPRPRREVPLPRRPDDEDYDADHAAIHQGIRPGVNGIRISLLRHLRSWKLESRV